MYETLKKNLLDLVLLVGSIMLLEQARHPDTGTKEDAHEQHHWCMTSYTVCYSSIRASACWHETQEGILDSGRATVLAVTATVPRGRSLCVWSLVHVLSHFSMAEAGLSQSVSHCFRWDFFHFVLAFQVCSSGAMGQPDWWIRITDCLLPYSFITFNFVSKSLDMAF